MIRFLTHGKTKNERQVIITEILPLQYKTCLWYMRSRKINIDIANHYVKEIHYEVDGNPLYSVAFPNDAGGYALQNTYFDGFISPSGKSTIPGETPGEINVFEEFISFLSMLVYNRTEKPDYDTIVLNSLVNLEDVMPLLKNYHTVNSYLPNNLTGRRGRDHITLLHPCVVDKSKAIYPGYKDYNEFIMG